MLKLACVYVCVCSHVSTGTLTRVCTHAHTLGGPYHINNSCYIPVGDFFSSHISTKKFKTKCPPQNVFNLSLRYTHMRAYTCTHTHKHIHTHFEIQFQ